MTSDPNDPGHRSGPRRPAPASRRQPARPGRPTDDELDDDDDPFELDSDADDDGRLGVDRDADNDRPDARDRDADDEHGLDADRQTDDDLVELELELDEDEDSAPFTQVSSTPPAARTRPPAPPPLRAELAQPRRSAPPWPEPGGRVTGSSAADSDRTGPPSPSPLPSRPSPPYPGYDPNVSISADRFPADEFDEPIESDADVRDDDVVGDDGEPEEPLQPARRPASLARSLRSLATLSLLAAAGFAGLTYLRDSGQGLAGPALTVPKQARKQTAKPSEAPRLDRTTPDADPLKPTIRRHGPWFRPDWAADVKPPRQVHYTIRSGGTLKNVANLYKIYHHEIAALNPGIDLDKHLPANTRVLIYEQRSDTPSQSLGYPGDGKLQGGVPMLAGPGRELRAIPWKTFATAETVGLLDRLLKEWPRREPDAHPVLVGNLSAREGGRLKPHSSHQSGRDFDVSYIQRPGVYDELNWREMNAENLDAEKTWSLIKLFAESDATEAIFVDRSIQKLLHAHALEHGTVPKAELPQWLQYPRGTPGPHTLVQHVRGHIDHMHVRFACPPKQASCKTRRADAIAAR
ncbi:MAG: hypothetical protein B7733_24785 [Myxococcales bacterium FL481]|nr:MAG: hypothetical protein B7733_24785 [Myxococcales bacterium FL481]